MNKIVLSVTLSVDRENTDDAYLDFNLTVDEEYIHPPESYVNPVDLVNSATLGGELYIFTCSCGDPGCLGIDEGIQVSHGNGVVRWKVRNPIAWNPEEALPEWTHDVEFVFDRDEYVSAVKVALEQAKALVRHWNGPGALWVGPGEMSVDQLMTLDISDSFAIIAAVDNRSIH
ncbi:hypothetical protein [Salidesulfovibrio onnuriiensis]|uniref:hypothetical protein n=1 Tax=Salidesulfovibrio onnuriiensis TaxID=2583823 RepID=UPI0011C6EB70|nr:hypothetical protein [Salidesulfovibrio onnuriiensis]